MQQSFEIMLFETRHLSKQNDNAPSKIKMAPFKVHNDIPNKFPNGKSNAYINYSKNAFHSRMVTFIKNISSRRMSNSNGPFLFSPSVVKDIFTSLHL